MRTPLRRFGIPASAVVVLAGLAGLVGCSDDDSSGSTASEVSIGLPATVVATGGDDGTTASPSTSPATTATIPPQDTSDIPLPPGSNDIPVFTPPETSDVPVYLSVTVGVDDAPDRVENVPFGATVTLDVVNLEGSDEYHLEGYELGAGEVMGPGQTYTFAFVANQLGDFSLESLASGDVLLTLHVG